MFRPQVGERWDPVMHCWRLLDSNLTSSDATISCRQLLSNWEIACQAERHYEGGCSVKSAMVANDSRPINQCCQDRPWAPAGMGKEGGHLPNAPWKCCKVICALVVTVKCSVDPLFMHYFHSFSSVVRPRPSPGLYPWTPLAVFRLQTP